MIESMLVNLNTRRHDIRLVWFVKLRSASVNVWIRLFCFTFISFGVSFSQVGSDSIVFQIVGPLIKFGYSVAGNFTRNTRY